MARARTRSAGPHDGDPSNRAGMSNTVSNAVEMERETLIEERESEMGKILNRHDGLLREQFQLENYGLMLYYDPEVAKEDQTNEFLRFKESHDLMRFMPSAGPSRTTRRAQNERISTLSHLAQHSISAPAAPSSSISAPKRGPPDQKLIASMKGKQKKRVAVGRMVNVANEVRISGKARGKRKACDEGVDRVSFPGNSHVVESISAARSGPKRRGKLKSVGDLSEKSSRISRSQSVLTDTTSSSLPNGSARSLRRSTRDAQINDSQPFKRRRLPGQEEEGTHRHVRIDVPLSPPRPPSTPAEPRPTTSGKSLPGKTLPSIAPPKSLVKRIRLIVRPPPRTLSSPLQRPNPASFGYSLPSLLTSYIEMDGRTYAPGEMEAMARKDARILNRLDVLKEKGRFPGWRLADTSTSGSVHQPSDIWANVVAEAIAARSILSRHRFGRGGALAAAIHSKLQAHWDLVKKDLEREQVLEERRLRALAKSVLKIVLAEWKKAVFHVREQARVAFEEEEARRGRQHLDAILDQSGQILEKQQLELVRSASMSVDGGEEYDEDGDEEEDDDVEEGTNVDVSEEEGDEEGTSAVTTEMGEGEDYDDLGHNAESYVDFNVTLNDVAAHEDAVFDQNRSQDGSTYSSEARYKDDFYVRFASEEPATPVVVEESQEVSDEELDDQHDTELMESPSNMASSKASPESTSFMEDIRMHEDDLPPSGVKSEGIHELHMSNGLEDDSIIIPGESLPAKRSDATPSFLEPSSSKPISVLDSEDKAAPSGVHPIIPAESITRPKLVNGQFEHVNRVNGVIASADVQLSESVSDEPQLDTSTKVEGTPASVIAPADNEQGPVRVPVDKEQGAVVDQEEDQEIKDDDDQPASEPESDWEPPPELQHYAVTHVNWEPGSKIVPPLLLRGNLRPYQQSGLEWLASLYNNETNGILADEMGLGKTIQTIALLAHLACDRGIWGPHLIIVPTSVLLNWEMEFKKFLPGFKILSYHGSTKRRKELRHGWNNKYAFNACITSYTLASRDQHIFKRKAWFYMILDEAHMIKNFKSQRWNILLMFRSFRRLLLTGTPLQNNLTELWALLRFLMSGANFANQKEFSEWFGIPLEKAIELGNLQAQEVQLQVMKLHEMLRPFLLRRLKKDVEKELPRKYEHLVLCRLSKRQRLLYDEFMSRAQTREDLKSGVYQRIANILMQLRKVCNHPDLFEVRPIVTSLAMDKSAIADFEIKEMLVRRRLLQEDRSSHVNLDAMGLKFTHLCNTSLVAAQSVRSLEEMLSAELIAASPGQSPPRDFRTIEGFRKYDAHQRRLATYLRYQHMVYLNRLRCKRHVLYGSETINAVKKLYNPLTIACETEFMSQCRPANHLIKSYDQRAQEMAAVIEKFAFATPPAVARDIPEVALREMSTDVVGTLPSDFDEVLHKPAVKLQIAFPDLSLLQYDCGKLQELDRLLRERKIGGHRVLIFTQMTRILDILEQFLNFHGYLYLRLDGATKIEDRQYITERFNADPRVFAFIASSRSGGVGINLTGADTVIFYDSDFNPQMDKQCEDRAHRIGQIRDVHIYRFISQYTVEEAMLHKANQKRSLDDIVIQQGDFDWKNFFRGDLDGASTNASAMQKALMEFEDFEDAQAAKVAAREQALLEGEDRAEFGFGDGDAERDGAPPDTPTVLTGAEVATPVDEYPDGDARPEEEEEEEEGGTTIDYMVKFVRSDLEFFREWKLP